MRKVLFIGAILICVGIITFVYVKSRNGRNTLPSQYKAATGQAAPKPQSKTLAHVVIITEENKPEQSIIGSNEAPYSNKLANTYARGKNYFAVTNPSLPNYIAMTSGTTAGIASDCNPPGNSCQADVANIADRLEASGKSWKAYAESMPSPCYLNNNGTYAVKHNPFLYYPDIYTNKMRCNLNDVPFSQFQTDLASSKTLPDYSFVTPNLCNDMHDCSVQTGDTWLSKQVPAILSSPAFTKQNSLLVIVWDEGDNADNNVPVIFAGPAAKTNYISAAYYSHYSLLHTIENAWGLQPLTKDDSGAPVMNDMLN